MIGLNNCFTGRVLLNIGVPLLLWSRWYETFFSPVPVGKGHALACFCSRGYSPASYIGGPFWLRWLWNSGVTCQTVNHIRESLREFHFEPSFLYAVKWARKVSKRSACLCVHCHAEKHRQRAHVSGQAKCRVYFRESGKIAAAQAGAWWLGLSTETQHV